MPPNSLGDDLLISLNHEDLSSSGDISLFITTNRGDKARDHNDDEEVCSIRCGFHKGSNIYLNDF